MRSLDDSGYRRVPGIRGRNKDSVLLPKKKRSVDVEKARITDARDTVRLMPGGVLKGYTRYEYMVGDLGPFAFEVVTSEDTPEKLLEEINRRKKILEAVK